MNFRNASRLLKNTRYGINKPMEDFIIIDDNNSIYILADGTTRPHNEYDNGASLADLFAKYICSQIHQNIIDRLHSSISPNDILTQAIIEANHSWKTTHPDLANIQYPPTATILVVLVQNGVLYYYNTADTIALLIRSGNKIRLTDKCNARTDYEKTFSKEYIYSNIHNNYESPYGFAMINGDKRFDRFVQPSHFKIEINDRIILSTDGLIHCLEMTPARILKDICLDKLISISTDFDKPPYRNYADDKAIIIIDVIN